jgi:hypothetical protein
MLYARKYSTTGVRSVALNFKSAATLCIFQHPSIERPQGASIVENKHVQLLNGEIANVM